MSDEEAMAKFLEENTLMRQETEGPDFAFSMVFEAEEGHMYNWGCMCTSLNPSNP